jgi:hypothetical protein
MINSKNSRAFSSTMVVTAIAICGITLGAAALLAPAEATPPAPVLSAADGGTGYVPALIANQAAEIELMPDLYY